MDVKKTERQSLKGEESGDTGREGVAPVKPLFGARVKPPPLGWFVEIHSMDWGGILARGLASTPGLCIHSGTFGWLTYFLQNEGTSHLFMKLG